VQPVGVVTQAGAGVLPEPRGLPYRFREVFGQVADVAPGFLGTAQDALDVCLRAESHDVRGFGQLLAGLLEGGQGLTRVGVGEGFGPDVPDRNPVTGVGELVMRWPPDLVVGGGGDGPQLSTRDTAPQCDVKMRGAAFLRFDRAEVLHIPADAAAGILPEPIQQRREVDSVTRRPPVVVVGGIERGPVTIDPAVGIEGRVRKVEGRYRPANTCPKVRFPTGRRGRSGASWRRRVERLTGLGGRSRGVSRPRTPAARSSVSSSATESAICSHTVWSPLAWHWV